MRYLVLIMCCIACSDGLAGEHPTVPLLTGLLKKQKDSKEVSSLVHRYSMSGGFKGDSGSFSSPDQAFTLLVRDNEISAIAVRLKDWPEGYGEKHWKRYAGKVPGNLSAKDGRDAVAKKLGKPVENRKGTWLHRGLYLWVHFDEKGESIEELWMSRQIMGATGE